MELDLSDLIQRNVYFGTYEPEETQRFREIINSGDVVLDVGANVGYFTALASRLAGPSGRVLALEPSIYVFRRLEKLIAENEISNTRLFNLGLSAQPGTLNLFVPPEDWHNHTPTLVPTPGWTPTSVRLVTLDDLLEENQVSSISLMKIDVEGHEPSVLAGGIRSIRSGQIKHLLIEFNDYWLRASRSSPKELFQTLLDLGFEDSELGTNAPEFSPDVPVTRLFNWNRR